MKYYMYHVLSWPQLLFVAEDHKGKPKPYNKGCSTEVGGNSSHGPRNACSSLN